MRVKEIEKLKKRELKQRVDEAFGKADEKGPAYLMEAQFYMRELEHRRDSWVSIRDFILEIVVIGLIGWEIRLGYKQEQLQSDNFDRQQQVLSNLQRSSAATAGVLQNSTQNFQDSASAAKGQIEFLQNERQERDNAVLLTLYKELTFNQGALADNEISLATELAALKESKTLIGPINTLRIDAWELLRLYLPHQISSSAKLLNSVTEVYKSTDKINGVLRSREEYRIHNGSMDNFERRMQAYDQQLQQLDGELSPRLKDLRPILKRMQKADSPQPSAH